MHRAALIVGMIVCVHYEADFSGNVAIGTNPPRELKQELKAFFIDFAKTAPAPPEMQNCAFCSHDCCVLNI